MLLHDDPKPRVAYLHVEYTIFRIDGTRDKNEEKLVSSKTSGRGHRKITFHGMPDHRHLELGQLLQSINLDILFLVFWCVVVAKNIRKTAHNGYMVPKTYLAPQDGLIGSQCQSHCKKDQVKFPRGKCIPSFSTSKLRWPAVLTCAWLLGTWRPMDPSQESLGRWLRHFCTAPSQAFFRAS